MRAAGGHHESSFGELLAADVAEIEFVTQHAVEANFQLAREAVEKNLTSVASNNRLKEGDFHDLRKELLQTAAPFYQEFVKQKARQTLLTIKQDPDLASVRGAAIDQLPTPEQGPWRRLWSQVDAAVAKIKSN